MKPWFSIAAVSGLLLAGLAQAAPEQASPVDFVGLAAPPKAPLSLWYRRPARRWVEALAVGNGRLGAMVFGGVNLERLQLNVDTLWAGGPYDPSNPDGLKYLPEARRLIFAGKYRQASQLIGSKMMAKPLRQMPYEPLGNLILDFPKVTRVTGYRRDLDLDTAIARVRYRADGVSFEREVFSSPVDQVIVVHLAADAPGKITFTASLTTPQKATVRADGTDTLILQGVNGAARGIPGALKFQARLRVLAQGGKTTATGGHVTVRGANAATLLIAAATSYKSYDDVSGDPAALTERTLSAAARKPYSALRRDHIVEHRRLFRRVDLDLGATAAARRPTNERIRDFDTDNDPQLAALYFQFGRYLLISCSRPGSQPANLQGLWNESMNPPWDSKYTININTEMNYWAAEPDNLAECVDPLISMVMDLSHTGARTAKVDWGARGWVCHHNTDLWRATAPIDGPMWGFWPTGGAWLCKHLWDHYTYNGDKAYLAKIYPVLKGATQFFLDTLVEEPTHHWLVTCPSLSPEHAHPGGVSICAGPTMDMEILRDLFSECIHAGRILGVDPAFRKKVAATRARLAPLQIGHAGQLQEWLKDWDLQAPDIHHRHVSHLYALFPSDQINVFDTPKLAAAARKSLEIRGDNATGWGLAWRMNLWARLQDGDHAYKLLQLLIRPDRTYPNLFDSCPPFQIDGNFGGTSGITEMLFHSRTGVIELLPALPRVWPNGHIYGLRARGGFDVGIDWKAHRLERATIHSTFGRKCRVRYGKQVKEFDLQPGQTIHLGPRLKVHPAA